VGNEWYLLMIPIDLPLRRRRREHDSCPLYLYRIVSPQCCYRMDPCGLSNTVPPRATYSMTTSSTSIMYFVRCYPFPPILSYTTNAPRTVDFATVFSLTL
jgi:hypothetical protein